MAVVAPVIADEQVRWGDIFFYHWESPDHLKKPVIVRIVVDGTDLTDEYSLPLCLERVIKAHRQSDALARLQAHDAARRDRAGDAIVLHADLAARAAVLFICLVQL